MKKIVRKVIMLGSAVMIMFSLSACSRLDVIGTGSVSAFEEVLGKIQAESDEINGGWSLSAPDDTVRFIWSKDFSESTSYDVMLELDAAPFINAGLDIDKLPENFMINEGKIIVGTDLGEEKLTYEDGLTPLASYEHIVNLKRDSIGYHAMMDHYGVDLGGGNMFEWAKDMDSNDKDIVFVLNPEPFIEAGVNPEEIEGWIFAKVPTMDDNGKQIEVDKILKPFEIQ